MNSIRSKLVLSISAATVSLGIVVLAGDVTPATQPAPTTQATNAAPTVDVAVLIKQLGSDSPDERDAAQKQLVGLGPSIAPALKKAAENDDDPEVRSRASAALAQMKDHEDNDTSLISVHFKDAPAQDVMDAIGSQAKAQFVGYGTQGLVPNVAARSLTVDADRKPFWDVMSDVCSQLNVCPVLDSPGKNAMRLIPVTRNWMAQKHQVVGPYWISVSGIYRVRSIDLMGPQTVDDQFGVKLIIYPEPKLAVTSISDLKLTEASDDAGNSLLLKTPPVMAMAGMLRSRAQTNHMVETRLSYPDQPGKRISLLRGSVVAMLAQDLQQFQVDDVLGGSPKVTNPLAHCTVKATVRNAGGLRPVGSEMYQVTLECTRDGLSDDKWSAMMNRMNDLTLEDADGHALTALSTGMAQPTTENTFIGSCLFARSPMATRIVVGGQPIVPMQPVTKTGEPKRLVWNVATALKSVTIPIELKDLPMP